MRQTAELANAKASERRLLETIRTADLVVVTAFHEERMTVDVKPLVKREMAGTYVSPPPVLEVKIAYIPLEIQVEGSRLPVKIDIKPGDVGVVVYLDLDSDNSIRSGGESRPNSTRLHSGDDAVFVGRILPG